MIINANAENSENYMDTPEVQEELTKAKQEQLFILQFISQSTGKRSQPFTSNWSDLKKTLVEMEITEHTIQPNDYILLVALLHGEQTQVPTTPLITVKSFLEINGVES